MINDLPSVGTALPEEINAAINTEVDRASGSGRTQSYALTGEKGRP